MTKPSSVRKRWPLIAKPAASVDLPRNRTLDEGDTVSTDFNGAPVEHKLAEPTECEGKDLVHIEMPWASLLVRLALVNTSRKIHPPTLRNRREIGKTK